MTLPFSAVLAAAGWTSSRAACSNSRAALFESSLLVVHCVSGLVAQISFIQVPYCVRLCNCNCRTSSRTVVWSWEVSREERAHCEMEFLELVDGLYVEPHRDQ